MSLPYVGIWWDNGTTIVALSHRNTENVTRVADRIDSNLAHVDEWPKIAAKLGRTGEDEYFSTPRGRVLWDTKKRCGVILHGPATCPERLELIALRFHLGTRWTAEQDVHYFVGDDADRLFDDTN
jgi:hypothetical protein